jgi:SHS2 domain-containing protein
LNTIATARYDYFDHDADIGIIGRGSTMESAYESAAVAVFAIMGDIAHAGDSRSVLVEFDEDDVELAFVRLLNDLLAQACVEGVLLSGFDVTRNAYRWRCVGVGGTWPSDGERGVEVKGATLTALAVSNDDGEWTARCVVDV